MSEPSTTARELERSDRPSQDGGLRKLAVVLAGGYAWSLTVLPPAWAKGPGSDAFICAVLALLALGAGPFLAKGRWNLIVSVDLFLGFCAGSWFFTRSLEFVPPFGVFGSLGWLVYTLALGVLSSPYGKQLSDKRWEARSPARLLPLILLLGALFGTVSLLWWAWKVERPGPAVLAHMFALAATMVLLRGSAHLSGYVQVRGTRLERALQPRAARGLFAFLALLVVGGVAWHLTRG